MPFVWNDYLRLADRLGVPSEDEAAHRTAISRAYYAIFCVARNRLRSHNVTIPKHGSSHVEVWNHYKTSPNRLARKIGDDGDRLRRSRTKADYEDIWLGIANNVDPNLQFDAASGGSFYECEYEYQQEKIRDHRAGLVHWFNRFDRGRQKRWIEAALEEYGDQVRADTLLVIRLEASDG